MISDNYVILFDENGSPYISHGFLSGIKNAVSNTRGSRQNHKYIAKVEVNGKTRYFYSQSDYDAYLKSKNNTVQAQRDLSANKRAREELAKSGKDTSKADAAVKSAQERVGRLMNVEKMLLERGKESKSSIKEAMSKVFRSNKNQNTDGQRKSYNSESSKTSQSRNADEEDKTTYTSRKSEKERTKTAQEELGRRAKIAGDYQIRYDQAQAEYERIKSDTTGKYGLIQQQQAFRNAKKAKADLDSARAKEDEAKRSLSGVNSEKGSRELTERMDHTGNQYNSSRIKQAVESALKEDNVPRYTGSSKELSSLYGQVYSKRESYETSLADHEMAKRELAEKEAKLKRARTELNVAKQGNNQKLLKEAQRLFDDANSEYQTAINEVASANKTAQKDLAQYKALVSQYNEELEIEAMNARVNK